MCLVYPINSQATDLTVRHFPNREDVKASSLTLINQKQTKRLDQFIGA